MLCLSFIFHHQPGCNYSIDVTSDEDSDIDHSLPRSRIVKVGSMHQTVMYMYTYAHVVRGIFWEHECLLLVNTTKIPSMWVVFCLDKCLCLVKQHGGMHLCGVFPCSCLACSWCIYD